MKVGFLHSCSRKMKMEDVFMFISEREIGKGFSPSRFTPWSQCAASSLKEGSLVCPWHGSELACEEGRALNSPATAPQLFCRARARRPDRGGRTNDAKPPRAGILRCKLRGSARDSCGR